MEEIERLVNDYLQGRNSPKLEVGRSASAKPGWLTFDLAPREPGILGVDVRNRLPAPDCSFQFVFCEHMIEHVTFKEGLQFLRECHRILMPGGIIRVVTPSLGFLLRVTLPDRTLVEDAYLRWSIQTFVPEAGTPTPAFFVNNFMRNWGHSFIYDRKTLSGALGAAGFRVVIECGILESEWDDLRGLEDVGRLPPGFLALESMVFEARKM